MIGDSQLSIPKMSIVVLNWNGLQDTLACLGSLKVLNYGRSEILVVDNASTDGSVQELQKRYRMDPTIKIIRNQTNLGYAEGNNVGIRYALSRGADYVLLLNNDTVVDRNLINDLMETARHDDRIGILSPKIYDYWKPDKVWFAGATIDWKTGESPHIGLGEMDHGQFNKVIEVDRLTGCAMMVKREVFEKIGLLDPDYFLYYEDVDFCVRAKRAGYKTVCVQSAKVWHKESSSTKANQTSDLHLYYHIRNRLLFLKLHSRISIPEHRKNLSFCMGYLLLSVFNEEYRRANSVRFNAFIDFYLNRFGIKQEYHEQMAYHEDHCRR